MEKIPSYHKAHFVDSSDIIPNVVNSRSVSVYAEVRPTR